MVRSLVSSTGMYPIELLSFPRGVSASGLRALLSLLFLYPLLPLPHYSVNYSFLGSLYATLSRFVIRGVPEAGDSAAKGSFLRFLLDVLRNIESSCL